MMNKIDYLKDKLNKLLESTSINDDDVLSLSRELDLLIVNFYDDDSGTIITETE